MKIEISKITREMLEDLRKELCHFLSQGNDLELMKAVENADYDALILLLNLGYNEKDFFDTLNEKLEVGIKEIQFTEKARNNFLNLLKNKTFQNESTN